MIQPRNVLVATDFSPASEAALIYGRALARSCSASLHLLHVVENFFMRPVAVNPTEIKAALTRKLDALLTADDRASLRATAVLETSDTPADSIVDYAKSSGIDCIVVGTHGRTGMAQLLVGSVAERVVRTAPCPVLTVRHPEHDFVAPEAPMITLKKILVATDFGEASDAALEYGREFTRTFGGAIDVLHVVENVLTRGFAVEGYAASMPDLQEAVDDAATKQLEAIVTNEDRAQLGARTVLRMSNAPAAAIVDYAREEGVDLIVMGTHGRGAVGHLLMGSVAERVVRTAPCPVLTVRHPEREFISPDALVAVAKS